MPLKMSFLVNYLGYDRLNKKKQSRSKLIILKSSISYVSLIMKITKFNLYRMLI